MHIKKDRVIFRRASRYATHAFEMLHILTKNLANATHGEILGLAALMILQKRSVYLY